MQAVGKKSRSSPLDVGRPDASSRQAKLVRSAHESFARTLEQSLSGCLQTETKAELHRIALTTAGSFRKELPAPSCLIVTRLHPRAERMILHVPSPTALMMIEMLLGGSAQENAGRRPLTEIEWSVLEEVVRVMVRGLGEAWRVFHAVEFEVETLGSDPSFLNLPDIGQPLAKLSFGMRWGDQTGAFELAVPQAFFDLPADAPPSQELVNIPLQADVDRNVELIEDAQVKFEVTLEGPTMAFEELMRLEPGQVITFNYPINKPLRATVNGAAAMSGHIISAMQKRAFQVERLPARTTA